MTIASGGNAGLACAWAAREAGVSQGRLDLLPAWRELDAFGDAERAAEIAAMAPDGAKDADLDSVRAALALALANLQLVDPDPAVRLSAVRLLGESEGEVGLAGGGGTHHGDPYRTGGVRSC